MDAIAVFNPKISNNISGFVKFHTCKVHRKTLVQFDLQNLPKSSVNAVHIHTKGITSLSDPCGSTCDHYNPHGQLHGSQKIHGLNRHAGDLINNMHSDTKGNFKFSYEDEMIDVYDILGRSVVIHAGIDDLGIKRDTDKGSATTGNAGGRMACAVIGRA